MLAAPRFASQTQAVYTTFYMLLKRDLRLYCFSPPVMLATFLIEIIGAVYVVWRYRMTVTARLIAALLVFLATFQGTEFLLCGGVGVPGGIWSRIGYGSITMLPPLGIHLIYVLARRKERTLVWLSYLTAAAFIAYFVFATQAISGHTCYANYAVFDVTRASALLYSLYYYGWLLLAITLAIIFGKSLPRKRRRPLYALMVGYLSFLIPTTTVNIIDPQTIGAIPSIMCGFAVLLALILVSNVAPKSLPLRKPTPLSKRADDGRRSSA